MKADNRNVMEIRKFLGIHLRRPLDDKLGRLLSCENVVVTEEGHLQARGGITKLQNSSAVWDSNEYSISCTASGTSLTGGAGAFVNVSEGDWISGSGVTEGTYVLTKNSNEDLVASTTITGGTAVRLFWKSNVIPTTKTGKIVGAHTHRSVRPWVFHVTTPSTLQLGSVPVVVSGDLSENAWWDLFSGSTVGYGFAIVSSAPFSAFTLNIGRASADLTISAHFPGNGGWRSLLGLTPSDFAQVGSQQFSFLIPKNGANGYSQDWIPYAFRNGVYGYAILIRIATVGGNPVIPTSQSSRIHGDFKPRHDLILATADVFANSTSLRIHRWGQGYGGVTPIVRHFPVDLGSGSGMTAGFDDPVRFATNDGVLYYSNGSVIRRHQGEISKNANFGFQKPAYPATALSTPEAGNLTGIFAYGLRYGFGPSGSWGKGSAIMSTDDGWPKVGGTATVIVANGHKVKVTFPTEVSSLPKGIVDVIHVYRSVDLTGAKPMSFFAMPYFRVGEVTRGANGSFPADWLDNYPANLEPVEELDIRDLTPPSLCRFIGFHKDRSLLAGSREHPSRVWRSLSGEWEAYDQSEYIDFARVSGGDLTAICWDYADMVICFTEDSMYGISSVDQDDWSAQLITNEVGCIAPESVVAAYGYLFWLAKTGVWRWDGEAPPELISKPIRLENCSRALHGGSRALAYNFMYEIELMPQDRGLTDRSQSWPSDVYCDLSDGRSVYPTSTKYLYNIREKCWQVTRINGIVEPLYWQPIATVSYPSNHSADGRQGPLYGRCREGASVIAGVQYAIGDSGHLDDTAYPTFIVDLPMGPYGDFLVKPFTLIVECKGVTTLSATVVSGSTIGYKPTLPTAAGTKVKDSSDTYDVYEIPFTDPGQGTGDLILRLQGTLEATRERQAYIYAVSMRYLPVQRKLMGVGTSTV